MKRFTGLLLTVAGAGAALWGGFQVLLGESSAQIELTDDVSVSAMVAGLIGVLVFTVGLVWMRD